MDRNALCTLYHGYLDCLNRQDWAVLGRFVHPEVRHNGRALGLAGYRAMLEGDFRAITDLVFRIELLLADPPQVASRLAFDCTPVGELFGLAVNGRRVRFAENVFYGYRDGLIHDVRSVIDTGAIAAQL